MGKAVKELSGCAGSNIPRLKSGAMRGCVLACRAREGTPAGLKTGAPLPAERADQLLSRGAWGWAGGGKAPPVAAVPARGVGV